MLNGIHCHILTEVELIGYPFFKHTPKAQHWVNLGLANGNGVAANLASDLILPLRLVHCPALLDLTQDIEYDRRPNVGTLLAD
jgi:hypothetical protein